MTVAFENQQFLLGEIQEVVDFLLSKPLFSKKSIIVLPCSLNDLSVINFNQNFAKKYRLVDYLTNDSMWLTYFFRFKYRKNLDRLYGPDLMKAFLQKACKKATLKHYFLASDLDSMNYLKHYIKNFYQDLQCEFSFLPKNISWQKEQDYLIKIAESKANVIWLGIGSPKQVELASFLKSKSNGALIFCVGAAFDFLSGKKKQAPIWMQNMGLEWFFRLCNEPKRLWLRYLLVLKYLSQSLLRIKDLRK